MKRTFLEECTHLLNNMPPSSVVTERELANKLSKAMIALDAVISQAEAQFAAGDTHATFNKQFIALLNK